MKRISRKIILLIIVALIVIQFFQPKRNTGTMTSDHLFLQTQVPAPTQLVLKNACMDCHSDQTTYQWYHKFAPVSWLIANHIREGKHELNFSEWRSVPAMDKIGALDHMKKEIEEGEMPLKSYTLIHANARLTKEQKDSLIQWIEAYQEKLVEEAL